MTPTRAMAVKLHELLLAAELDANRTPDERRILSDARQVLGEAIRYAPDVTAALIAERRAQQTRLAYHAAHARGVERYGDGMQAYHAAKDARRAAHAAESELQEIITLLTRVEAAYAIALSTAQALGVDIALTLTHRTS